MSLDPTKSLRDLRRINRCGVNYSEFKQKMLQLQPGDLDQIRDASTDRLPRSPITRCRESSAAMVLLTDLRPRMHPEVRGG